MRIIAGVARSRRLVTPPGRTTRPMSDRMRESLFSSLAARIPGSRVADLYAGSGSMGLEALSRGAKEATFVERDRKALRSLQANIDSIGLGGRVVPGEVDGYLETAHELFDLAFVDPPYALPLASLLETLGKLSPRLRKNAIVVVHRRSGEQPPETVADLSLVDRRSYGGSELWRYVKERM